MAESFSLPSPAEQAPWPKLFTPPQELLAWLKQQRPADSLSQDAFSTLAWLIAVERGAAPAPPPKVLATQQLLDWLNTQRPADKVGKRAVLTLRWVAFSEVARSSPEPPPTSITHFVPDGPVQTL